MAFIGASYHLHRMRMDEYEDSARRERERQREKALIDSEIKKSNILTFGSEELERAINAACSIYVFDDNNISHVLKNKFTFGYSSSYREGKANNRSEQWLADLAEGKDPKQVLHDILTGPGGKNLDSLKYQVLSQLTELNARHYEAARLFIDRTVRALEHAPRQRKYKK